MAIPVTFGSVADMCKAFQPALDRPQVLKMLIQEAEAGTLTATLEIPWRGLPLMGGLRQPAPAPNFNVRSAADPLGLCHVLRRNGAAVPPDLVGLLPTEQQRQFSAEVIAKKISENAARKQLEKFGGAFVALTRGRLNLLQGGKPNVSAIVKLAQSEASAEGEGIPHGWGDSSMMKLFSDACDAFENRPR